MKASTLTFAQKRIQRKIAKASKRGRYLIVSRRGRRDRPGRKKGLRKCNVCSNFLSKDDVGVVCRSCTALISIEKVMNIPKMSRGE